MRLLAISLLFFCVKSSATGPSKILNQLNLDHKQEQKYLKKLNYSIKKDPNFSLLSSHFLLKQLIPTLPKLSRNQKKVISLQALQEHIDYLVLARLNLAISTLRKTGKSFDANLKINNKTLLQHAVENGYLLTTNRLLSEYAIIDESVIEASLNHEVVSHICQINESLKQRLTKLNKISLISRSHAKKICHLYKQLMNQYSHNKEYKVGYKNWHNQYKSITKKSAST
ncbi:MAG: hypothetical protein ACOYT8_01455 [Candidatus Dependentiae bacterium]